MPTGIALNPKSANYISSALPIIYPDKRIRPGTIALYDLSHSLGHLQGPLGGGAVLPNVAASNAAGIGLTGSTDATLNFVNGPVDGVEYEIGLTPKGGVSVIWSQVNDVQGRGAQVGAPSSVKAWIFANPGHAYFVSRRENLTRSGVQDSGTQPEESGIFYNNYLSELYISQYNQIRPTYGNTFLIGQRSTKNQSNKNAAQPLGFSYENVGATGYEGTLPSSSDSLSASVVWGPIGFGGSVHKSRSSVFYSWLIEDLTVTAASLGITVAQAYAMADAADYAAYQASIAAGGALYGDTPPTNPSTLP